MADHEVECVGRPDGGWHLFENVFHGAAHTCYYCGITDQEAFSGRKVKP